MLVYMHMLTMDAAQGGAWCNSAKTCRLSKATGRGSSDHMDKAIPFTGIMSSSRAVNPGSAFLFSHTVSSSHC
jgi:hypothetical protein